jgi:pimeloyl-ACP methyl ester carboxylesterase
LTHVLTTTLHHHFGRKGRRSSNGTEIAGRVQGDGPPVVFVSSAAGDGDTSWAALMPYVTDRLTWFLLSTRGRGLSQDAEDHSCGRLVEDVTAFVDSIGEPVGLVGHSSGAMLSLAAAAASDAVGAVAAYEPGVAGLVDEATAAQAQAAAERALETASDGRLVDAARHFFEGSPLFNDEEVAHLSEFGVFEHMARYFRVWVQELRSTSGPSMPPPSSGSRPRCCCSTALEPTASSPTRCTTSPPSSPTRAWQRSPTSGTWAPGWHPNPSPVNWCPSSNRPLRSGNRRRWKRAVRRFLDRHGPAAARWEARGLEAQGDPHSWALRARTSSTGRFSLSCGYWVGSLQRCRRTATRAMSSIAWLGLRRLRSRSVNSSRGSFGPASATTLMRRAIPSVMGSSRRSISPSV